MQQVPIAHVSIDLDTIDTHLAGYGLVSPPCDRIYAVSVPRLFDLLERVGMHATIFVIARDAEAQAALWRDAMRRGHEIASHSVSHPVPFATLAPTVMDEELRASRARLEAVIGTPVRGFRAPGWDVDAATLRAVGAAGYGYDASIMPSPALLGGECLRLVLSRGRKLLGSFKRGLPMAFSQRQPHRLPHAGGLWEFPVAVSPVLRLPFTHTLWHIAPAWLCERTFQAIRRSGAVLCYQFHAADLLELEDGIDPRMACHPGITRPLRDKLMQLEMILRWIGTSYRVVPYRDALVA